MRVVLADDHPLFRDGVASLLAAWGHEVVGDGRRRRRRPSRSCERLRPDLVLMDVGHAGR